MRADSSQIHNTAHLSWGEWLDLLSVPVAYIDFSQAKVDLTILVNFLQALWHFSHTGFEISILAVSKIIDILETGSNIQMTR